MRFEATVTWFEFARWNRLIQATVPQKCIRVRFRRKIKFVMPHKKIHMHFEKFEKMSAPRRSSGRSKMWKIFLVICTNKKTTRIGLF